ncbi:MAG: hypothetical protein QOE97_917 [Pseudonocardiales bacterium]|nr:hypothetical protein [Pseudonocardiales bacterium]
MNRTRLVDLVITFVIVGVTIYALLRFSYGSIPPLGLIVPAPLAALGVAELIAARRVRAAVRHLPNARMMPAIVIARCVALGKASSIVGAVVAGAAGALLLRVLPDAGQVTAAANDALVAALLFGAAVLLVVAGLALERAGIDPNRHNGQDERGRP